ncbi:MULTISPECIES: hypothetical protein [Halomonadaceae]|uniref:Acetyltransferase n=1 Tax=Modicisalibacter zincidurans TaxID=1178777 RepID=A0ABP9RGY4_9GAMM|nr:MULTISPECIES: hypothetical protein [Halomonas]MCD6009202.1 hypothetical protein [Halomonas sp. IOP_31]MEA3252219.1 acetyltransferase [Pseudomonadota bacterium]
MKDAERLALAARVRDACVAAALAGHEEAAIAGLCSEGALEAAISAIQMLDLENLIDSAPPGDL